MRGSAVRHQWIHVSHRARVVSRLLPDDAQRSRRGDRSPEGVTSGCTLTPNSIRADEVPAGGKGLRIQTRLNGETMQDANTENMIFDIASLIEIITEVMTLHPGDIIVSGTPDGVGFSRSPPLWLKQGDSVEVAVEDIGILCNRIEEE